MKPNIVARAGLAAALLTLPVLALAQTAAPSGSPPSAPAATATAPSAPAPIDTQAAGQKQGRRVARVEQRVADLHARLRITPAQDAVWDRFADVMRDNARTMDQTFEQRYQRVPQMSAVDNMQSYAQLTEAHAQDVQKLVPAFQSVYDTLSPEQRRTADQLFRNYAERSERRATGRHG